MDRFCQLLLVPGAKETRNEHIGADRQAHEEIRQQIDQRRSRTDRGKRIIARKPSNNNDIRSIEK